MDAGGYLPAGRHFSAPIVVPGDLVEIVLGNAAESHTPAIEIAVLGHAVEQREKAVMPDVAPDLADQFFDCRSPAFKNLNERSIGVKATCIGG